MDLIVSQTFTMFTNYFSSHFNINWRRITFTFFGYHWSWPNVYMNKTLLTPCNVAGISTKHLANSQQQLQHFHNIFLRFIPLTLTIEFKTAFGKDTVNLGNVDGSIHHIPSVSNSRGRPIFSIISRAFQHQYNTLFQPFPYYANVHYKCNNTNKRKFSSKCLTRTEIFNNRYNILSSPLHCQVIVLWHLAPGILKSQAAQISSLTIAEGCNRFVRTFSSSSIANLNISDDFLMSISKADVSSLNLHEVVIGQWENNTMKISVNLSILLLTLIIKIVIANANLQLPSRQYCGSSLANIMQIVCKNKYNGPSHGKKRNEIDSDVLDYKDLEDYNAIDYPYQPRQEAMLFMPTRIVRSSKRTIIDECCRRPCLISELKITELPSNSGVVFASGNLSGSFVVSISNAKTIISGRSIISSRAIRFLRTAGIIAWRILFISVTVANEIFIYLCCKPIRWFG
ncbi:hypothetical protein AGLY_013466 [Aphis glycines]|uniref:Insulin-like domain-containing protein n=1 Tax=Aphis glycines TaxID=307491 RepID=A0A6G0T6D7_APHGL|nr:hypothetical protein AGLY_013466 [Aphis glycines]